MIIMPTRTELPQDILAGIVWRDVFRPGTILYYGMTVIRSSRHGLCWCSLPVHVPGWCCFARFLRLYSFLHSLQIRPWILKSDCPVVPHACLCGQSLPNTYLVGSKGGQLLDCWVSSCDSGGRLVRGTVWIVLGPAGACARGSNQGASGKNRERLVLSALSSTQRVMFARLLLSRTIRPVK
jgi:hypothetical protein